MAVDRPNSESEAGLVDACKRGDLGAFEHVYTIHSSRMKSIAFHLLGDRSDAEDAVQDAFLRIYRALAGFHGESGFQSWMYRILINCCYDAGRKRKRQPETELGFEHTAVSSNVPLQIELRRALAKIHSGHRMVFWLFEVEGFRHSEIGSILEIPEGTSRKWLFEAKRDLKRLLMEARA
ncbi:MAG: RNA polymerase sigma factor [Bryobacteraceae bacterium]